MSDNATNYQVSSGTLMLHLLGRCNLQCRHCYMNGSPARRDEIPMSAVMDVIAQCPDLGVTNLYLTGGEAILYPEFESVLRASTAASGATVTVCTNGMLVTDDIAGLLQETGVQTNVSIDGEPEYHDWFRRQEGAFAATELGVSALVAAGVPVSIVTTVSRGNLDSLGRIAAWAAGIGAKGLFVLPLLKLGRGVQLVDQCLSDAEMDLMLLELSDLGNTYRSAGLTCRLNGVATRHFLTQHPCGAYVCNGKSCHRGVSKELKKIVIRESGTVLPEMTNISSRFALGNIMDPGQSLTEMVANYLENDYDRFDQLCRTTYEEVLPTWTSTIVPWDEIIAARSHQVGTPVSIGRSPDRSC